MFSWGNKKQNHQANPEKQAQAEGTSSVPGLLSLQFWQDILPSNLINKKVWFIHVGTHKLLGMYKENSRHSLWTEGRRKTRAFNKSDKT